MMEDHVLTRRCVTCIIMTCMIFLCCAAGNHAKADMASSSYVIKEDGIVAGGANSESASYNAVETCGGDEAVGLSVNATKSLWGGLWYGVITKMVPDIKLWSVFILIVLMSLCIIRYRRNRSMNHSI